MIKKLLLIAGAAIGGIYLTSDEGKNAREALLKKKSAFEPIIKDLLEKANDILEGTDQIDSKEVKANIDLMVSEAKQSLIDINLDSAMETIKDAIRVASKKIRIAMEEVDIKENKTSSNTKKIDLKSTKTVSVKTTQK